MVANAIFQNPIHVRLRVKWKDRVTLHGGRWCWGGGSERPKLHIFDFFIFTVLDNLVQEKPSTSSGQASTSGTSSSPGSTSKPHPINPNHVKLSHFTVLAGGGQKGSWSIHKPKRNAEDVADHLKGKFWEHLMSVCKSSWCLIHNLLQYSWRSLFMYIL